jgi:hypothetical protein
MQTTIITSTWQTILQYFFPVFTAPTAQIFANLLTGWVLCTARRTVTGIISFADPLNKRPHDAYHRFFPDARWQTTQLWKMLAMLLVKIFYPTGTIPTDLDDTLFHRTGRKVNSASWWRDAVRSTATIVVHAWGLNLVVLTVRIYPAWGGEPLGLPINVRLRTKGGPSHIDLAQSMLAELSQWLPQRRFLCHCDGFYTALIDRRPPTVHIISRMRKDAILYGLPPQLDKPRPGRRRVRGDKLATPAQLAEGIKDYKMVRTVERGKKRKRLVWSKTVIWYHVSLEPVVLVISRDPQGKEKDDFFVTTDLSLLPQQVVGGFAGRWSIEDTFRNTKQLIGVQQPQTFKRCGPERAAVMGLWLYSVVWLWYLHRRRGTASLKLPWYCAKARPSFADALAALRRMLWKQRIKCMFEGSVGHDKIPEYLIRALSYAA